LNEKGKHFCSMSKQKLQFHSKANPQVYNAFNDLFEIMNQKPFLPLSSLTMVFK